jgi:hypothetical protein
LDSSGLGGAGDLANRFLNENGEKANIKEPY